MKRVIFTLMFLLVCNVAVAAQTKVTALTEDLTPTTDDLVITVDNPSGAAATKKATMASLRTLMLAGDGSNLTGILQSQLSGTMAESNLSFTDITTSDVSTTKHGFAPKSPNDATKYLDGTGAYTVPSTAAAGGWTDLGAAVHTTTASDKVGIGVSNPAEALAVVGNVTVTGTLAASGVITGGSFSGNATTATLATTAVALQANGANCSANEAPLGVDASGAVEGCFGVLAQAAIDTSAEIASIVTDETGTGSLVFHTAPTFSGAVTAGSFEGDGSALTGVSTSFTTSAALAALMSDETGTLLSVFSDSPTFTTMMVLPNAAAPTVDATAEFAFDTNIWAAGHGAPIWFDGTSNAVAIGAMVADAPTDGQVLKYKTAGIIEWEDDDNSAAITVADTQVVFADGANTPAGDAGFVYNKTTNIATADGFNTTATANPLISFVDSDAADGDVNGQIDVDCTDGSSGTEDCQMRLVTQVAGAPIDHVLIGSGVGLMVTPPADQTIAGGNTITDDGCGTIKAVTSSGAVVTSTTNTFTAPASGNDGCCMDVINVGSQNITLDNNANFLSIGGADIVLTGNDATRVCSNGSKWYSVGSLVAN